jgi:chromosome segregation ATPase
VSGKSTAEGVVDELLAIPPKQFTEARNAAAKQLAANGERDAAGEIKALPRPTLALWSLNRVAHEQSDLVEAFIEASAKLRAAHETGGDIRAATPPQREAEAHVAAAAAEVAAGQGSATETVMRGIRQALGAAAADTEVATTLRAGRLIREPAAPSIDQLLGSLPHQPAGAKAKAPSKSDRGAERRALQDEIAEARRDATEARTVSRDASSAARDAKREWERAQELAERAEQQSEKANERVEELQARLKEL